MKAEKQKEENASETEKRRAEILEIKALLAELEAVVGAKDIIHKLRAAFNVYIGNRYLEELGA